MNKTRILLGSALALSLMAVMAVVTRPRPVIAKPGEVAVSKGGSVRVEARPSHTAVHANGTELFAEYTVTLVSELGGEQPISLALVLDTSGSMAGSKLEDARKAAHRLVDLLGERDELALVSFGSDITTADLRKVTPESRQAFHAAIDTLQASGATNISGATEAGWTSLRRASGARRLVLVSDGQPTVGLVTPRELSTLVGRVHDDSITVTALGVGSDIDGNLMMNLAERGGGMYGYLANASALEEILGREVGAARSAVARNVELTFQSASLRVVEAPGRQLDQTADGRQVLHLADLRPHTPTRVLVRVESPRSSVDDRASLSATVSWRSLRGEPQRSDVGFTVAVVEDERDVLASRDEAVFSRGVGAAGNLKLLAAAAAWERGDSAQATSLLDNARALFGMSADALAGQSEVDATRVRFSKTTDAQGKKEFARGLERKKLSDFGKENEGY